MSFKELTRGAQFVSELREARDLDTGKALLPETGILIKILPVF